MFEFIAYGVVGLVLFAILFPVLGHNPRIDDFDAF